MTFTPLAIICTFSGFIVVAIALGIILTIKHRSHMDSQLRTIRSRLEHVENITKALTN